MEKLGIEPVQLLLQAFNFIILVVLLTKFLYKPILKVLNERKNKIAQGFAAAEKMKADEEKMGVNRAEIIAKASQEAKKIIEEGKAAGKNIEADIIAKAHRQAGEIIEKGKRDVELESIELEKRLREKTVDLAEAMLSRILIESLTDKSQKAIIDKKISQLTKLIK